MGEMVEVEIFLKKENFSVAQILSVLEREGLYVDIKEMSSFEDWQYTNEEEIDLASFDWQTSDIFLHRFTRMYFIVNGTWACTALTSLIKDIYIDVTFAVETADLVSSSQSDVIQTATFEDEDQKVAEFYQKVINIIDNNVGSAPFQNEFIAASMAVENVVNFEGDLLATLHDEYSGSMRWVLPKDIGKDITLKKFSRAEKSNTFIFTRLPLPNSFRKFITSQNIT